MRLIFSCIGQVNNSLSKCFHRIIYCLWIFRRNRWKLGLSNFCRHILALIKSLHKSLFESWFSGSARGDELMIFVFRFSLVISFMNCSYYKLCKLKGSNYLQLYHIHNSLKHSIIFRSTFLAGFNGVNGDFFKTGEYLTKICNKSKLFINMQITSNS